MPQSSLQFQLWKAHRLLHPVRIGCLILAGCLYCADADAALKHRWQFDGNGNDSIGKAHGTLHGSTAIQFGALVLDGGHQSIFELPAAAIAINEYPAITLEVWAKPSSLVTGFTQLVGFGDVHPANPSVAANYFDLETHRGDNSSRAAISISDDFFPFAAEDFAAGPEYNDNQYHFYAAVLTNSSISLYTDGQLRQTSPLPVHGVANTNSGIGTEIAQVGKLHPADSSFIGSVSELRIYDEARTASQIQNDGSLSTCLCFRSILEINRDTGSITLKSNLAASNVDRYAVSSASGGLNPAFWQSIADNFDADSGSHSFDADDNWVEQSPPGSNTELSESVVTGGNGGAFGDGGTTTLQIGAAGTWRKSIYEDLQVELHMPGGGMLTEVHFTGNDNQPFKRSDLNFDNQINVADWNIFLAHSGENVSGLTRAESYGLGDLSGDLVLDRADFRLFKADYNSLNGAGAFAAATGVPEPNLLFIAFAAAACLTGLRARRRPDTISC